MEMVAFGKVVAGTLRMLYWKIVYIYMMKIVYSLEMSGMLVPHSKLVG
jgi:hypothetical protein